MWRTLASEKRSTQLGRRQGSVGRAHSRATRKGGHPCLSETHPSPSLPLQALNTAPLTDVPARLPDPVRDPKVHTHLEGAPAPGTAGAHRDGDPEPSRRLLSSQPARARLAYSPRPLRRALPAARSHGCRLLLAARSQPTRRSHRRRALPASRSQPRRRPHLQPAPAPLPHTQRVRFCALHSPAARYPPGSAPQNAQRAPWAFKGTAPHPRHCCPEAASGGGCPRSPREV